MSTSPELTPWPVPRPLPPRSLLVGLEPIGVGTRMAESLVSYLLRLAEVHGLDVGVLADLSLRPLLTEGDGMVAFRSRFQHHAHPILGVEPSAEHWQAAIEEVTGRTLSGMTLARLAPVLPRIGLVRPGAVCAACLAEMRDSGKVWEPLIWSIVAVTVCRRHQVELVTCCPACGKALRALGWRALVGHCRRCGAWLGDAPASSSSEPYALWVAERSGELVAALPTITAPSASDYAALIDEAVMRIGSQRRAAKALGIGPPTISGWRKGSVRPPFASLMALAAAANIDPARLLAGSIAANPAPSPLRVGRRQRRSIDWDQVRETVRRESESDSPRPLSTLARDIGVSVRALREQCSAEVALLRSCRASARKRASWIRQELLERAVSDAVYSLESADMPASRRALESRLSGALVREEVVRLAWRRAVQKRCPSR